MSCVVQCVVVDRFGCMVALIVFFCVCNMWVVAVLGCVRGLCGCLRGVCCISVYMYVVVGD